MHDSSPSRRQVLRASIGVTAAAGMGVAVSAPPSAAGTTHEAARQRAGRPEFPPVPGMIGDRKANEFWYQFNVVTLYERSAELDQAFEAIGRYLEAKGQESLVPVWWDMVKTSAYPHNYTAFVRPVREPLRVMSRDQLGVFDRFYRRRSAGLVKAFSLFAQGVLYDPRQILPEPPVHTMNHLLAYHAWHAFLRAMMFSGIDRAQWAEIDPVIGFAWALQSVAEPDPLTVNQPLPAATVRRVAASWLPRSPARLDRDFQSFPEPSASADGTA